jgi:hypothetical protein
MNKGKKKIPKKVTVTFDERHLPVIVRALECFTRLRAGQIDYALDEVYMDKLCKSDGHGGHKIDHVDIQRVEDVIRQTFFPELGAHRGRAYGVGQYGNGGEEAYEISKVFRQYLAYERNDGYAGFGVDYNSPCKYSDIPLPKITGFDTRKFFKAPKKIQKALEDLYDTKQYIECFKLIEKKWNTLPKGDKIELGYRLPDDPSEHYLNIGVWVTAPRK